MVKKVDLGLSEVILKVRGGITQPRAHFLLSSLSADYCRLEGAMRLVAFLNSLHLMAHPSHDVKDPPKSDCIGQSVRTTRTCTPRLRVSVQCLAGYKECTQQMLRHAASFQPRRAGGGMKQPSPDPVYSRQRKNIPTPPPPPAVPESTPFTSPTDRPHTDADNGMDNGFRSVINSNCG